MTPATGADLTVTRIDPNGVPSWGRVPPRPAWPRLALDRLRPTRRVADADELAIAARAQAAVAFPLLLPRRVPLGYRLAEADMVPGSDTLATLVFDAAGERGFRLTQRLTIFGLDEELERGDAHRALTFRGLSLRLVEGAWVGEPCCWNWQTGRRTLLWEQDGRVCELEEVIVRGPTLGQLLVVASRLGRMSAPDGHGSDVETCRTKGKVI